MNKCNERRLIKRPMDDRGRLKHPKISRYRHPIPAGIVRDLSDRQVFPLVHRYRSDPGRFAIHSHIPLEIHGLIQYDQTVFKIAAVDRFEIGTLHGAEYYYEVKCLTFGRYQK